MKKGILLILLISFLIFNITSNVIAANVIKVKIDGKEQSYEQPPVLINNSTMVPLRGIFETLGAKVLWDNATRTITATKEDIVVKLVLNQDVAYINGKSVKLTAKAQLINNRTMVPLRFVSEALNAIVEWDQATYTVIIKTIADGTFTQDEKNLLLDELELELNQPENLSIITSIGEINLDGFEISVNDDQSIQVNGTMTYDDYILYTDNYQTIKAEIEEWADNLSESLHEIFPTETIYFTVYFHDFVSIIDPSVKITDIFLEEEVEYNAKDGSWLVTHWIIDYELQPTEYYRQIQP